MNKKALERLWEEATDLPDAKESPLAIAIIAEALGEGDDGVQAVMARVEQMAVDCGNFADAITALTDQ